AIMATFIVDQAGDDAAAEAAGLTLREALALAAAGQGDDRIEFSDALAGETIFLGERGELTVASSVVIDGDVDGDGTGDITISARSAAGADDASGRVMVIDDGVEEVGLDVTLRPAPALRAA
ncbi:MAG: hypothetical protein AAF192_19835, partial [Pseudomonadota bacterium]